MSQPMGKSGGAFVPSADYTLSGALTLTGTQTISGTTTLTSPTITSPTISGTAAVTYTTGSWSLAQTLTASSYAPSTYVAELLSKITLTPTSSVTAANGLMPIRGEVNITAAKTLGDGTASYVMGVYGRVNFNTATVNIGSGDLAAVYGKFDMGSTSTLTSGHIAPLQANIVNPPAGAAAAGVSLIYAESASGTAIGSILNAFSAASFAFDLSEVGGASTWSSTTGTCTTPGVGHGWIKINLNGSTRYIALSAAVS